MFTNIKEISIESKLGINIRVKVKEYFINERETVFTWPCSYVLSAYLTNYSNNINNAVILELGAGTALPSIVCGLLGAKRVYINERESENDVLNNIRYNINLNNVQSICEIKAFDWGKEFKTDLICDIIIGSDVFYSKENFNEILLSVITIMITNPNAIFITTYQERSISRTLRPYLDKFELKAQSIPLSNFLHHSHSLGQCIIQTTNQNNDTSNENVNVSTFDDINLIIISSIHKTD